MSPALLYAIISAVRADGALHTRAERRRPPARSPVRGVLLKACALRVQCALPASSSAGRGRPLRLLPPQLRLPRSARRAPPAAANRALTSAVVRRGALRRLAEAVADRGRCFAGRAQQILRAPLQRARHRRPHTTLAHAMYVSWLVPRRLARRCLRERVCRERERCKPGDSEQQPREPGPPPRLRRAAEAATEALSRGRCAVCGAPCARGPARVYTRRALRGGASSALPAAPAPAPAAARRGRGGLPVVLNAVLTPVGRPLPLRVARGRRAPRRRRHGRQVRPRAVATPAPGASRTAQRSAAQRSTAQHGPARACVRARARVRARAPHALAQARAARRGPCCPAAPHIYSYIFLACGGAGSDEPRAGTPRAAVRYRPAGRVRVRVRVRLVCLLCLLWCAGGACVALRVRLLRFGCWCA